MNDSVFDSSVIFAILRNEPYDPVVLDILDQAVMSTVNLAEVMSGLSDLGLRETPRVNALLGLLNRIEAFSQEQARLAGQLRAITRQYGLSLGDRSCLALAIELGATVYTADKAWAKLSIGVPIRLIR